VTVLPVVALGVAVWQAWGGALHWSDVIVFAVTYLPIGFGITVGFHRLLTHRAFRTSAPMRGLFAALGSAAIEGPVIEWVAHHRKHHAFADQVGDPHSPHVDYDGWRGGGLRGALRGLFYAHVGWILLDVDPEPVLEERFAPDLLADRTVRFVDRTFLLWAALGLAFPFGLGVALTGTVDGGLTGLLWGGGVRVLVMHHVTFSINSLCHVFGRRRYDTDDQSRNLGWLALPSLGEAWHHNHHAFPTSAAHGLRRRELDPSALLIAGLERVGLVWDVVRVSPSRQEAKVAAPGV
jgi:stearoyl-CoA desaturase (delta-9 desaturase)